MDPGSSNPCSSRANCTFPREDTASLSEDKMRSSESPRPCTQGLGGQGPRKPGRELSKNQPYRLPLNKHPTHTSPLHILPSWAPSGGPSP